MTNEDTLQQEADLRARGFIKCFFRQKYLLKERMVGGVVTSRMIMSHSDVQAKKEENTLMKINYGTAKYKWVHPDEYADNRYAYASAQDDYTAPEPIVESEPEVEDTKPTEEAVKEFITDIKMIGEQESANDIFEGMTVAEMRALCKSKYGFKLSKAILSEKTALNTIKKFLED